ncbi:YnbE family lipoprotein [Inquilinus sp. CAU 1745]|uniref:YnbE family lipoprotein n=1 Tax=Inquilinus sp. CAU 1745 TaxID=3140369 RepID=UPI00325A948A
MIAKLTEGGGNGRAGVAALLVLGGIAAACTPTVRVEPPDEPIEINLNVRIEQEVRVKIDRDLEDAFAENSDIF